MDNVAMADPIPSASSSSLQPMACEVQRAAQTLGSLDGATRNQAIQQVAQALTDHTPEILAANDRDCELAQANGIGSALYARLKLTDSKWHAAVAGVRQVGQLPDPLGVVQIHRELDQGLVLRRVTYPLGVLGVIFEARPDAVVQISALALKSGNGAILKGGQEAVQSCQAIVSAIQAGLAQTVVSPQVIQLLTTREETLDLLKLDRQVNLIIPRGSNAFVRFVQENTRIPVLGHADGICHLYIDASADLARSIALAVDSKTQYPAACNAIETLLIHHEFATHHLGDLVTALQNAGVELRGDDRVCAAFPQLPAATDADWATEYSDLILSVKVVDSLDGAIDHINTYGSKHTDGIVTEDQSAVQTFFARVNSAGVYHNCSTRFADGFRYGLGAEVGISTQTLPPRGPVGLEGLVTYKYELRGEGQGAATYSGDRAKPFTHRDLPLV